MVVCSTCGEDNPERARFCLSCGTALREAPSSEAEERKIVSVLFVDLVGFTAASEHADPEDVRARLRPYHTRVKQEIERFGGIVEKFVGDAVMAVFGAPIAHEDDAERAVSAALRILASIDELNEELPGLELAVRAAVNTGEAVVALAARPGEGEGIVAGDVVNTAARLQQAAPVGGVVVGEATYAATKSLFEYEQLDAVAVKGKAEPLSIWLARTGRRRFGVDVEPVSRTPLIGRDDDLALLQSTYRRTLRESSIQLVTVVGEPGVGKTRLVAEFRSWVDDLPELVFWRQGRCLPYGEGITYWALGEMVKAQAGILESDDPEGAAAKLAIAVQEAAEDPFERDWLRARLAPLVGASAAAAGEREESFAAWRRFLEGIAAQRPLVLMFEDLHWADEALLEFVEYLVDWSTGLPLLVVCTARPELYERHAGWGGGKRNSNTISLSPLGAKDTTRLLSALLRKAVLPVETQTVLLEHCGGNPLYAEEFVRMLTDRGVVTRRDGLLDGVVAVPDTVQALIAARLDTLPAERKGLLHDAAVVGKVFWAGAVASMGGRDERTVREGLHELARKELVRPVRTSSVKNEAEYSFWHLLVRDVAYAQIPRLARSRKHETAARWIEQMAGERVADHAELLAYHYMQALELARAAGDPEAGRLEESALRFLIMAGERAKRLDFPNAEGYYLGALALAADDLDRARILLRIADVAHHFRDTEKEWTEALDLFRARGDDLGAGEALLGLSNDEWLRGHTTRAEALLAEGTDLLERHPPGHELAHAYRRKAGRDAIAGRARECLVSSERALRLADQLGETEFYAVALQARGIARCELADLDRGLNDLREALRIALEASFAAAGGTGYSNLGSFTWLADGPAAGLEVHRAGYDFADLRGLRGTAMWLKAESTWMLYDLGHWDELLEVVGDVIEFDRTTGGGQHGVFVLPYKAQVLVRRGQTQPAASLADEFLPRAREALDPQVLVPALAVGAVIEQARGDLGAAVELANEVDDVTRGRSDWHRARFLPELAAIWVAAGEVDHATAFTAGLQLTSGRVGNALLAARAMLAETAKMYDEALALYEDGAAGWSKYGFVLGRGQALLGAGRCLVALGRAPEAAATLAEARSVFIQLGARPLIIEADAVLSDMTSLSA